MEKLPRVSDLFHGSIGAGDKEIIQIKDLKKCLEKALGEPVGPRSELCCYQDYVYEFVSWLYVYESRSRARVVPLVWC